MARRHLETAWDSKSSQDSSSIAASSLASGCVCRSRRKARSYTERARTSLAAAASSPPAASAASAAASLQIQLTVLNYTLIIWTTFVHVSLKLDAV